MSLDVGSDVRRSEDAREGRLGLIMALDDFGFDAGLFDELDGGEKAVEQEGPLVGVEIVQEGNDARVIEALVAEVLSDVSPIFAFDMGIVVFVILARARVLDRALAFGVMLVEWPVEEL